MTSATDDIPFVVGKLKFLNRFKSDSLEVTSSASVLSSPRKDYIPLLLLI